MNTSIVCVSYPSLPLLSPPLNRQGGVGTVITACALRGLMNFVQSVVATSIRKFAYLSTSAQTCTPTAQKSATTPPPASKLAIRPVPSSGSGFLVRGILDISSV